MNKAETLWGPERGYHFYKTSDTAVRMVLERINLEECGLPLNSLPLCSEQDSVFIEELIPRAKEGFALLFKSERSVLEQDRDLLELASPQSVKGIWTNVKLTERQNTLPEYWHVLATLKVLTKSGRVSFFQFEEPPVNLNYEIGTRETYWFNSSDSFEKVWVSMDELEKLIRLSLYSPDHMSIEDTLKVGHFFMTGKSIAKVFESL